MFWFSIILFFVLMLALGYSISFFVKKPDNFLEKNIMNLGFGLGAFAVLAVFLNLIKIQIHWIIFLLISLIIPAIMAYKHATQHKTEFKFPNKLTISKSNLYILGVLVIFAAFFYVYHQGAFSYPYLEDDDPWLHAQTAKYISTYKTLSHNPDINLRYTEPYPPAFAALMGVLHQTNTNIIWSLKFFNVLLISLSILFFYFFSKEFFGKRKKALFATFGIAIIPCFLSHFIWASSLAITLFFPAFYATLKIKEDKKWWIVAAVTIAGIMLSQPSNAIIFGLMFIMYWVIKAVTTKSFQKQIFLAGFVGLLVSVLIFFIPIILTYGWTGFSGGVGLGSSSLLHFSAAESGGGLLYSWSDFFIAPEQSKMDNPTGIGSFLFILTIFSILVITYYIFHKPKQILSEKNCIYITMILWLLFAFAGIHGNRLPVQLMPHRFWAILAIPVVLISAEGFFAIADVKKFILNISKHIFKIKKSALEQIGSKISDPIKISLFFVYGIIIIGLVMTSAQPKYVVETSKWPPGVSWSSFEEISEQIEFIAPLKYNSKLFPICSEDFKVLAFDKFSEPWDPEYVAFKKRAFNVTAQELHSWLKAKGYEYMTIDASCVRKYDANSTNNKLAEIQTSQLFNYVGGRSAVFLFRPI